MQLSTLMAAGFISFVESRATFQSFAVSALISTVASKKWCIGTDDTTVDKETLQAIMSVLDRHFNVTSGLLEETIVRLQESTDGNTENLLETINGCVENAHDLAASSMKVRIMFH